MRYTTEILAAIMKERKFQDEKYGPVRIEQTLNGNYMSKSGPGGHDLGTWVVILESELDECKSALVHGGSKRASGRDTARQELIQLAAVCVAALEQHGLEEPI